MFLHEFITPIRIISVSIHLLTAHRILLHQIRQNFPGSDQSHLHEKFLFFPEPLKIGSFVPMEMIFFPQDHRWLHQNTGQADPPFE